MNNRTRKLGIRAKILIPSIAVIILVCLLISQVLMSRSRKSMVSVGGQVAQSVAMAATGKLNMHQVDSLIRQGEGAADVETLTASLESVIDSYDAINLYILGHDNSNGSMYYALSAGSDKSQSYGTSFEHDYEYLKSVYADKIPMADNFMSTKSGVNVITAYAPITNNEEVIAVLACDYDASDIQAEVKSSNVLSAIISLICAIVASVIITFVVSAVVRNLNKVNNKVSELASNEGDLTQSIDVNSGDETELIANNFNVLLEYIRTIMLAIDKNVDSLKDSSVEMVSNLGDASDNVSDINATMVQMNAAMQSTTDSINHVAGQIQEMNCQIENIHVQAIEGSNSTVEISKNAANIREKAVAAKDDAKIKADHMADTMKERIEKSKQVSEIDTLTQQILAITNQTRLLSLNASIEAARAGELGKGFSVVAQEIGKLANESGEAAGRIKEVSKNVVAAVTQLAEEAENMITFLNEVTMSGYDELEQTSVSYSRDTKALSDLMEQFAHVSERLQEYSDNIHKMVDNVNLSAQESSQGIMNVSSMTGQMADRISSIVRDAQNSEAVAAELNAEVNKFKLN